MDRLMNKKKRIIVGITGATGVVYGIRLLEALRDRGAEIHLILSGQAKKIIPLETGFAAADIEALARDSFGSSAGEWLCSRRRETLQAA